jgi:hypothetical protein
MESREELEAMKVDELRDLAKERGVEIPSGTKKAEIVEALASADEGDDADAQPADADLMDAAGVGPDEVIATGTTPEGEPAIITEHGQEVEKDADTGDALVVAGPAEPPVAEAQAAVLDELPEQDATDPGPRESWPVATLGRGLSVLEAQPALADGPEGEQNTEFEDRVHPTLPNPEPGTDHAEVYQDPETKQWSYREVAADGSVITFTHRGAFPNMTSARKAVQKKVGPKIPVICVHVTSGAVPSP